MTLTTRRPATEAALLRVLTPLERVLLDRLKAGTLPRVLSHDEDQGMIVLIGLGLVSPISYEVRCAAPAPKDYGPALKDIERRAPDAPHLCGFYDGDAISTARIGQVMKADKADAWVIVPDPFESGEFIIRNRAALQACA